MRLHLAGKVSISNKGIFEGVSVTTFALGTTDLYAWLDGNNDVAFLDVETVNDPLGDRPECQSCFDQRRTFGRSLWSSGR